MLRMVGYGENLGSGFPLILNAWEQAGWGKPELKNKIEIDEVELDLPVMKLVKNSKEISEENKREMSDVLKNVLKKLTERQIDILELIVQTPNITLKEMSQRVNVSVKTVQRDTRVILANLIQPTIPRCLSSRLLRSCG